MIHFERTRTIDATPEAVWAVLGRYMHVDEFAPLITSVDALTDGEDGIGSKRRNHFTNGTSLVEEVTAWAPGRELTVQLSDMGGMPLRDAYARTTIEPVGGQLSKVTWGLDLHVKYGPFGWILGQTVMRATLGKIIDGNLKGLADKVRSNQRA
ncbi:MAG: SRPBCC family protein [Rhodobacteraceae bacterium]|nr:SRPBCC family protein [Paracoccaceae bacterium]